MTPNALKTEAEIYMRRIWAGCGSLEEIVGWADSVITEMDEPPPWLLDLSLAKSAHEAKRIASQAPGVADLNVVRAALTRTLLARVGESLSTAGSFDSLLSQVAARDLAPAWLAPEMQTFMDSRELWEALADGEMSESTQQMLLDLLARWLSA